MFQMADESWAVTNAHADLKKCVTDVILSNDEDSDAGWFESHFEGSL